MTDETTTEPFQFVMMMPWGRVGSNLLTNILKQSGKLQLANEPMTGIKSRNKDAGDEEVARLQMEWFNEFFNELSENNKSGGAKLSMASVVDVEGFVSGLVDRNMRMIYMDRRNLVKTAISILKAEEYAAYHKEKFGNASWAVRPGRELKQKTTIDVPKFTRWLDACQTHQAGMKELAEKVPGLEIFYEDIMFDIDGVVAEALSFMKIAPFEYEIPFVKAVSDDLRQEIANFDDVLASLQSEEHRRMLLA